ncbi:phage fiber-tail adaptor protein [Oceanibacterium hippocampi]|uniref:Uncharacterized protein n=1 Tax=Oceanibacterium hippocampi TaxID=745714 RepID=A0A1Y5SZR3_9PROT|nr:hypothetical protein [Oceanibacterium hippocampi]SLN50324.1 hypothetical protein OCH7691_02216 [Oceanibacterium hippocampi]
MAIPGEAIAWAEPLDPADYKEYVADWAAVMAGNGDATIASAVVALSAEAVAAGVEIDEVTNPPSNDGAAVTIWFRVNAANQLDAGFDGTGATFGVEITVTDSDGRTLQRTWKLTVRQR